MELTRLWREHDATIPARIRHNAPAPLNFEDERDDFMFHHSQRILAAEKEAMEDLERNARERLEAEGRNRRN